MNKFCILGILILGVFNVYSGCSSCKGRENGGGEGVSSKNKKGKNKNDKEEKDKKALINKISGFINDSNAYNNKELNQFKVKINEDNKVEITFEGGHFKATSVDNWDKILKEKLWFFNISIKASIRHNTYWKFKDDGQIKLEYLRKSLEKIDNKLRENRKSHYLCVKGGRPFVDEYQYYIDLSDGLLYIVCKSEDDDNKKIRLCNLSAKCTSFFGAYYNGEYFHDKTLGYNTFKDFKESDGVYLKCAPSKAHIKCIGELDIVYL